ncbi:MAG: hypothetical protein ACLSVD_14680 [Eggerthellaceae bacterium]
MQDRDEAEVVKVRRGYRSFQRELFAITYDLQKILHDTMTPICQEHGLTLQQMHVLVS